MATVPSVMYRYNSTRHSGYCRSARRPDGVGRRIGLSRLYDGKTRDFFYSFACIE